MTLNDRENSTVLAALRLLQLQPAFPTGIDEIATDGGSIDPLTDDEIDALCDRLNSEV